MGSPRFRERLEESYWEAVTFDLCPLKTAKSSEYFVMFCAYTEVATLATKL